MLKTTLTNVLFEGFVNLSVLFLGSGARGQNSYCVFLESFPGREFSGFGVDGLAFELAVE